MKGRTLFLSLLFLTSAMGEIFFQEKFDEGWESRWVQSKARSDYGKFKVLLFFFPLLLHFIPPWRSIFISQHLIKSIIGLFKHFKSILGS